MTAAGELCISGKAGDDRLRRRRRVKITGLVGKADYRSSIRNINEPWIGGRVKSNAEGVIETIGEMLDLGSFAPGPMPRRTNIVPAASRLRINHHWAPFGSSAAA
jgi:hypothetical protein